MGKDGTIQQRVAEFARESKVEDRVHRIMQNMLPEDAEQVLAMGPVPPNCTNPNAVVVGRVRKIERAMERPRAMKRYDEKGGKGGGRQDNARSRSRNGSRGRSRSRSASDDGSSR